MCASTFRPPGASNLLPVIGQPRAADVAVVNQPVRRAVFAIDDGWRLLDARSALANIHEQGFMK